MADHRMTLIKLWIRRPSKELKNGVADGISILTVSLKIVALRFLNPTSITLVLPTTDILKRSEDE